MLACVGGVAVLVLASTLSFETVRAWLDVWAADGSADAFAPALHRRLLAGLRLVGVALLVLGAVFVALRKPLGRLAARFEVSSRQATGAAAAALGGFWAEPLFHRVTLALIVAGGVVLRLVWLQEPMRYDESYTFLNYARYPLVVAVTKYDTPNNHILHSVLMHGAFRWLGDAPWALRLPAWVAGVLVMPATYAVARRLFGSGPALLTTGLVATSAAMVGTSVNGRGYSLLTLWFLLLIGLTAHVKRTDSLAGWVAVVAVTTLGAFTIPIMLYGFATAVVWLVLSAAVGDVGYERGALARRLAWSIGWTGVLTFLLYAPSLMRAGLAATLTSPTIATKVTRQPWAEFVAGNTDKIADAWQRFTLDLGVGMHVAIVLGLAIALLARVGRDRVPLFVAVVVGCLSILLAQGVVPWSRVWLFLFPVVMATAAAGIAWLVECAVGRRPAIVGGVLAALTLALFAWHSAALAGQMSTYPYHRTPFVDAEAVVKFLKPQLRRGDRVLMAGTPLVPFQYYSMRHELPYHRYVYDDVLETPEALRRARRIFIVVSATTAEPQTVARMLDRVRLPSATPPPLLRESPWSRVFVLEADGHVLE
jgi:hypothetical protein